MTMHTWAMLTYRIAREPTAGRVSIWRKLKKLGAIRMHDSVWVLPATDAGKEQLQWLAVEIREMGGEAALWLSEALLSGSDDDLVRQFTEQTEDVYRSILAALKGAKRDVEALSRQYQQAQAVDYFHSKLGDKVRNALLKAGSKVRRRR
jgi:Protein ChrB, N-terminal